VLRFQPEGGNRDRHREVLADRSPLAQAVRLHWRLEKHEKHVVSSPREYPVYTPPGYYAFYFKDPEGIKYEIVSTGAR
jgi:hypothetical protein